MIGRQSKSAWLMRFMTSGWRCSRIVSATTSRLRFAAAIADSAAPPATATSRPSSAIARHRRASRWRAQKRAPTLMSRPAA